jgi:hypothetical protein
MKPEASADSGRASPPPPQSPVPSGAGKSPSSLWGGTTSSGRVAPKPTNSRAEDELASPPDQQHTGASHMGAGSKDVGPSEPLVPPVEDKKQNATVSPSKASSAMPPPASRAATPTPAAISKTPAVPHKNPPATVTAE